jgi:hypothetical protein
MSFANYKNSEQLECQAEPVEAGLHNRTRLRQAQADILINRKLAFVFTVYYHQLDN